ncbi:MAG: hypothetical protein ACRCX2_20815 [Paraclostridium sp.]
MFFEKNAKDINARWNINDFIIGGGNKTRKNASTTGSDKEDYELSTLIKKIDTKFSKTEMELDAVYKDLRNKRKEMRARFKALESDPENEASFHKLDVDLMMAQVRIIESKAKAVSDKHKHIRDEKKLAKDLIGKNVPETQINVQTNQNNSPLANVKPTESQVIRAPQNFFDPSMIVGTESKFTTPKIDVKVPEPAIPSYEGADRGSVAPTTPFGETPRETIAITKNWDGTVTNKTGDNADQRKAEVMSRLNNAETLLKTNKSAQGIDYERSVNAIINRRKNLEKVMFVNKDTGTFYVREYEIDEDGSKNISDTELFNSILHIGIPEFNIRAKTVKSAYAEENMKYVTVEDDSEMPEYYKNAWREPDKTRFLIPNETLELL